MRTTTARRLTAALGGAALATGLLAGFAGAASAAPGDLPPSKDRVIRPQFASGELLVPTSGSPGARIVTRPRIGKAQNTPESQVWTFDNSKKFDDNGKVIRGARSYIFQPTFDKPGVRPLCVDVVGNSTEAGAGLELRPCDGTPSQVFRQVGDVQAPFLQNVLSGLNLERQADGTVVQQPFVPRPAPNASLAERTALRERGGAQIWQPDPKTFGFGGA
jgi:hypothetical protein